MHASAHRRLRVVLGLAAAGHLMLGALTLWLLRDPLPRMAERRSAIATVDEGPERRAGGILSMPVRVRASSGLEVDLIVRRPAIGDSASAPREPRRRPLYLLLGGYRTGARAAMLVEETRGAVVAAMDYPYDGPLDVRGPAVLGRLPDIRRAILDTPPAIALALDYLLAAPEVDPERVELVGVSLGAFFAPVAAALDPRITRLWLVHGAARPREVLEHGLRRYVEWALPREIVAVAANVVFAGPQLAPERWLPRVSPRPVIMIGAAGDRSLPRDAVEALYASAREPKDRIRLPGRHVHPEREDVIRRIMDAVFERAAEGGAGRPGAAPHAGWTRGAHFLRRLTVASMASSASRASVSSATSASSSLQRASARPRSASRAWISLFVSASSTACTSSRSRSAAISSAAAARSWSRRSNTDSASASSAACSSSSRRCSVSSERTWSRSAASASASATASAAILVRSSA